MATIYDAIGVWVSQDCATVLQNEAVLRIRIQEKMQRHHRLGLMSEHTFPRQRHGKKARAGANRLRSRKGPACGCECAGSGYRTRARGGGACWGSRGSGSGRVLGFLGSGYRPQARGPGACWGFWGAWSGGVNIRTRNKYKHLQRRGSLG
jgi:hypothetical protein